MKKKLMIVMALLLSVSLSGCGVALNTNVNKNTQSKNIVRVNNSDILKPIEDKIKAMNDKKMDNYLSSYIKGTSTYSNEQASKDEFFKYDKVKCSISDPVVIDKTNSTAQVQYIVNTQRITGTAALDNTSLYLSDVKKVQGQWKIESENVLKTEFKNDVFNVINSNIQAMNKKDINAYMNTIDPTDNNAFTKFKSDMLDQFDKYSLTYSLESADVIGSNSDNDTAVKIVMTVIKNDNSDFQNVRITENVQVRKVQGQWKIFKVEPKKTENLK
ncbi:MAG: nuclear transport factor 2 family protein [Clostridium sp.]|nr:nuclear transport factor 2 family protein [Clostridium sp.]